MVQKHKKISNNTVIEIDNGSPLEILKLQQNLLLIAAEEGIAFVNRKGQKKRSSSSSTKNWKDVEAA